MSSRIYFHTPTQSHAESVVNALKENGLTEEHISVISKEKNIQLTDLPNSDLSDRSDLVGSLKRGAGIGAATGLIAGIGIALFPIAGLAVGGAAVAGMTAGGAAFGAWSASLIGVSERHPIVEKFSSYLEQGGFLIIGSIDHDDDQAKSFADTIAHATGVKSEFYGTYESDLVPETS